MVERGRRVKLLCTGEVEIKIENSLIKASISILTITPLIHFREYSLPARDFHGLWDSLFYDDDSSMGGGRRGNQAASCGSVNGSNKTPATDNQPKDIPPLIDHQEPRSNGNVKTRLLR